MLTARNSSRRPTVGAGIPLRPVSRSCRTALLLATALTGSLVLMSALTVSVRADETVNSDETVIGLGGGGTKGSSWDIADDLYVGSGDTGTLTISDGGKVSSEQGYVGRSAGGNGTVTITGASSTWEITAGKSLYLGVNGAGATGTLIISNGGKFLLVNGPFASLGAGSGGTGTVTVTGAGSSMDINGLLSVGNYGAATLTVSDGASVVVKGGAGTLYIALYGGSSGALNIGAAAGDAAAASGTIDAAEIKFGAGTGKLVLNHTDVNYVLDSNIIGAGVLEQHSGTTVLTGNNTYSGGTTISGGTLQVGNGGTSGSLTGNVTNNSALIFNRSDALTYAGDISGTGTLTKSGAGTLTLTGTNSHTGGTTISGGLLTVNGSTGAITLNGGTLGGSGTVGTVVANSGSSIAPGNSIGTLNVAGDTGFAAGSTYAVEVDKNGNADKIAATGTVSIDSGATVTVSAETVPDDGSGFAVATTYTIVTAGTGVTGTFGSVSDNFAFLDASLSYDANNVYLKLLRNNFSFASSATTANQRATAGVLDTLVSGNTLYDAVSVLSADSARTAFDSLSGEIYPSTSGIFIQDSRFARNVASNRMRRTFESAASGAMPTIAFNGLGDMPNADVGMTAWSHAYGSWSETSGNGNAATIGHHTGGFFFGADADVTDGWRGGLMAGYGTTSFDVDARASSGSADSYTLGAYGGHRFGPLSVSLGANYALHDVSTNRTVTAGALTNALSADYGAATGQLFGEAAYTLDTPLALFEPFAGFALIHQRNDAFTETGGAAALSVGATSQTLGITTLGLRAERQLAASDHFTTSLNGSLGWSHVIGDLEPAATMRLASGDAFNIAGAPLDRDTVLIEAGLNLDFSADANLSFSYQGNIGTTAQDHGLSAKFSAKF